MNGKIYNLLNFIGLATAVFCAWYGGIDCVGRLLDGIKVLLMFLPFFCVGGIGGGDVKAFVVIAVWMGFSVGLRVILATMIIGVIYAFFRHKKRIKMGVFMPFAHILSELLLGGML